MTWSAISKLLGILATLFAAWLLWRVLSRYDAAEIFLALRRLGPVDVLLALFFAGLSFAFLSLGEFCAVRYAGQKVGVRRVARTAVAAIGIGHAVGLAALSSGAIRYRMYGRAGVPLAGLGRIMLFAGFTVAAGMTVVGGVAMVARPQAIAALIGLGVPGVRAAGLALLALAAGYLALCALHLRALQIGRLALALPSWKLAAVQTLAGAGNYAAVAGCLYACLRPFAEADYPTVATLFVGADATALIGHVPGGWGVLEYVLTAALHQPHLIAGILVFRSIYYLLPLFAGLAVFVHDEVAQWRARHADGGNAPPGAAAGLPR
ncbi:MAG: YbhN family protein [Reyranellaceae bacterium]